MAFFHLNILGDSNPDFCILDEFVEGIEIKAYMAGSGMRLGSLYPRDARIPMTETRNGLTLPSLLGNTQNMLMVSSALRTVIERICASVDIEYLPFTIMDHRKRRFSSDYTIVNPIGVRDCLDYQASGVKWGTQDPTRIVGMKEFVLDRQKMEGAPPLFRVQGRPAQLIINQELM